MQISRTQNQQNFKARVKTINPKATAAHLQSGEVTAYNAQKAALKAIGDNNLAFGLGYNPKNLGPFMILGQLVSPKTGETTVKFKEGLHLSDLAKKGKEMHEEMTRELSSAPVYQKVKKPKAQLEEEIAEISR